MAFGKKENNNIKTNGTYFWKENLSSGAHVLHITSNLIRCQSENGKEMYPNVKRTRGACRAMREFKHATFLSHGRQPEMNSSHARTVLSLRFLTLSSLVEKRYLAI